MSIWFVPNFLPQDNEFYINWKPNDLSHEDVASLFSSEADGWAMIDEIGGCMELVVTNYDVHYHYYMHV